MLNKTMRGEGGEVEGRLRERGWDGKRSRGRWRCDPHLDFTLCVVGVCVRGTLMAANGFLDFHPCPDGNPTCVEHLYPIVVVESFQYLEVHVGFLKVVVVLGQPQLGEESSQILRAR